MLKVINLFGGPGCGKSTSAAGLFYLMKQHYYNVELVTEFAKQLEWDKRHNILSTEQIYVFAKQLRKQHMLKNQAEYIITDSPLLFSLVYATKDYPPEFRDIVMHFWNEYENYNFFVKRTKEYVPIGRSQTKEEAIEVDSKVRSMLIQEEQVFTEVDYLGNIPKQIFKIIDKDKELLV